MCEYFFVLCHIFLHQKEVPNKTLDTVELKETEVSHQILPEDTTLLINQQAKHVKYNARCPGDRDRHV